MASMNPVELYHDPALDDLIQPTKLVYRNAPEERINARAGYRSMSDEHGRNGLLFGSPAQGAPISYRGVGPNPDPGLHRSFSQRVKGRPFAEEAFMDDDDMDEIQHSGPRRSSNTIPIDVQQQTIDHSLTQTPARVRKDQSQQSRIPEHKNINALAPDEAVQRYETTPKDRNRMRTAPATVSADMNGRSKSGSDGQQGKWAHDRSPLQKLEVKLTDISKEEKRARVQEAEMRFLQEKRAGKVPERQRQSVPRTSEQKTISREQPTPSKVTNGQSPGVASRQNAPVITPRGPSLSQTKRKAVPVAKTSPPVQSNEPGRRTYSIGSNPRSSSGQELANAQPQTARAVSMQPQKPSVRYQHDDRPATQHERNASHQAALEQLTGARQPVPKSNKARLMPVSVSKTRMQDETESLGSPIGIDLGSMAGGAPALDASNRADLSTKGGPLTQYDQQPQISNKSVAPTTAQQKYLAPALGLQNPSAMASIDSPPASLKDASKQRQRKSSVSFKEPFDRRRPVDEWKGAVTATLTLEDFSFAQTQPPPATSDGADLDTPWWEKSPTQARKPSRTKAAEIKPQSLQVIDNETAQFRPQLHLKCGPLLRYCGMRRRRDESKSGTTGEKEFWRGSIMIVTQDSQCSYEEFPTLRLFSLPKKLLPPPPALVHGGHLAPEYIDPIAGLTKLGRTGKPLYVRPVDHIDVEKDVSQLEDDNGIYESSPSPLDTVGTKDVTSATANKRTSDQDGEKAGRFREVKGVRIYADPDRDVTFWRFNLEVELGATQQHIGYRINKGAVMGFWVPAKGQTMNIMFHSCNGFSMSVNSNEFSGPDPLWRDVLNNHQTRPFHVMLGGGDQIYNDRVTVDTHWFSGWTKIKNPHAKHQAPFTNDMKEELESFYLERYCMWFSQGLFALANSSIPMVNLWDDHDIIDGFGSYPHDFMRTPVFSGLGNIAYKYYMLFQHQSIDAMSEKDEPSWLLGHAPGPYIHTKSRNIFMELGQSVAFLGIDCRTERTKNDVMSIDTLELILDRCRRDMVEGRTKHLIVLLGVPIAYPRLVWLENILTSRAIEPFKALGRAGILKPGLLNKFDGGVEILDDLDDHWTASHHKDERNVLIQELQDLAAEKSARITILSGDVHLAAIGQFYSNPKLRIPKDKDHRYMPNVISSAIVNTPPPDMMADVLNKRNKVHHLDEYTDENMIPMFTHDVDRSKRNNTRLLPRRNWCSIREYIPGETPPPSPSLHSVMTDEDHLDHTKDESWAIDQPPQRRLSFGKAGLNPMNLVRRFSSRKAPPTSYRDDAARPQHARSASFDGSTLPSGQQQQHGTTTYLRASSADQINEATALRPTFHRRPTNLSEKAARKGIVNAIDAEGNEIDVNDHINLQGGLDIVINCEVDKKDPSGITLPYRFLVPALWYDGSSDREKLEKISKPSRKATVLNKFGLGARPNYRSADPETMYDFDDGASESDDSNEKNGDLKPRRTFSLFGSKKKKQQPSYDEDEPDTQPMRPEVNVGLPNENDRQRINQTTAQPRSAPVENGVRTQPVVPPTSKQQPYPPPQSAQQNGRGGTTVRNQVRPPSFVLGGKTAIPNQIPSPQPHEQFFASEPYDSDALYVQQQHEQRLQGSGADAGNLRQQSIPARQSSSKQARLLGITSDEAQNQNAPPTRLRGNGILGKEMPPTAYRSDEVSRRPGSSSSDSQIPRGYSGIEAYRDPKAKRRWSLSIRDKARGFLNNIEGRGNNKQRGDLYSDDEEEDFWEGPKQDYHQGAPPETGQQPQSRQLSQKQTQNVRPQPQPLPTRGHNRSTSQDRSFRQWGPMYSYEKGRVYPYDTPQQGGRI